MILRTSFTSTANGPKARARRSRRAIRRPARRVWEGNSASADDVDRAVRGARRAFAAWSASAVRRARRRSRSRFAALLNDNKEALAERDRPRDRQAAVGSAHRSGDRWPRRSISRCSRTTSAPAKSARRWPTASRCCGIVRMASFAVFGPYNFPGPLAERAYRAGADRGQRGRVQAVANSRRAWPPRPSQLWTQAGLARRRAQSRAGREGHRRRARESPADRRPVLHRQLGHRHAAAQAVRRPAGDRARAGDGRQQSARRRARSRTSTPPCITRSSRRFCRRGSAARARAASSCPTMRSASASWQRLVEVTSKHRVGAFDADPQPFMGAVVSARAASRSSSPRRRD